MKTNINHHIYENENTSESSVGQRRKQSGNFEKLSIELEMVKYYKNPSS